MHLRSSILFAAFCLSLGCDAKEGGDLTAEFEGIVRTRSSLEFPCDPNQINIEDLDG